MAVAGWMANLAFDKLQSLSRRRENRRKTELLKAKCKANKNKYSRIYSEVSRHQEEQILSLNAENLVEKMISGELRVRDVLEAFIAKALDVDRKTNCVVVFIDEALNQADELDKLPREKRGKLHGLPISVKEHVWIRGELCTAGLANFIDDDLCEKDATLVANLRSLGAVPFCRTNLSQGCASIESSNPIFGLTSNFWDASRTAGGSSGGEGAIIAGGGSVLGIGSDLGASVRAPAIFNGICGLRPTGSRLPLHGQVIDGGGPGVIGPVGTLGLLARSAEDIDFVMRNLLNENNVESMTNDARFVPLVWRDLQKEKIRVLWYDYDHLAEATPGMRRVVREAAEMLGKLNGFEVKQFLPESMKNVPPRAVAYLADQGKVRMRAFADTDLDTLAISSNSISHAIRDLEGGAAVAESWQLMNNQISLLEVKQALLDELEDIDIMIVPAFACPALKIGHDALMMKFALTFLSVFNLLDFPAGIVKISEENEEDQRKLACYPEFERHRNESHYASVVEGIKGALGMPLAVQVVGKPWHEELVLKVMQQLQELRTNN